MAKHKEHQQSVEETPVAESVEVEVPKVKIGDEEPTTTVDVKEKSTKPRASHLPKDTSKFRVLEGVEAAKFAGQRGHVIRALQVLQSENPEGYFTVAEIAARAEGLVSKTPVEDSVNYHLKAMVAEKMVEVAAVVKEAKAESVAA